MRRIRWKILLDFGGGRVFCELVKGGLYEMG